mmetsp:Transcript_22280/g.47386  ORF Transcript_22280/g.47386 Transcript_22280/m.47386 type:complete len:228 (-) Transcript_22280:7-690(-)
MPKAATARKPTAASSMGLPATAEAAEPPSTATTEISYRTVVPTGAGLFAKFRVGSSYARKGGIKAEILSPAHMPSIASSMPLRRFPPPTTNFRGSPSGLASICFPTMSSWPPPSTLWIQPLCSNDTVLPLRARSVHWVSRSNHSISRSSTVAFSALATAAGSAPRPRRPLRPAGGFTSPRRLGGASSPTTQPGRSSGSSPTSIAPLSAAGATMATAAATDPLYDMGA